MTVPAEDESPPTPWEKAGRWGVGAIVALGGLFAIGFAGRALLEIGLELEDALGPLEFLGGFIRVLGDVLTTFLTVIAAIVTGMALAFLGARAGHLVKQKLSPFTANIARFVLGGVAVATLAVMIGGAVEWLYQLAETSNARGNDGRSRTSPRGRSGGGESRSLVDPRELGCSEPSFGSSSAPQAPSPDWSPESDSGCWPMPVPERSGQAARCGRQHSSVQGSASLVCTSPADGTSCRPGWRPTTWRGPSSTSSGRSNPDHGNCFRRVGGARTVRRAIALALHTTASLAKLYPNRWRASCRGPIEAVTATGATRLQSTIYAVVPQIVPPYIAFTLYRWDINVRMSTIIGFAGGGGIGFLLQQNINLLLYRAAAVQMLAIAIVVGTLDFVSARIRERIV